MRKVIITDSSHLIGFDDLARHAMVKKCWQLPRHYILFEVEDPVFRSASDVFFPSRQRAAAILEEAALFAPFYKRLRSLADIKAIHVRSATASYHLVTAGRTNLQWPLIHVARSWDTSRTVHVVCRFASRSAEELRLLKQTLAVWQASMQDLGQLRRIAQSRAATRKFSITCHFTRDCGDATMALFMLLAEKTPIISLTSVAFLSPGDFAAPGQEEADRESD